VALPVRQAIGLSKDRLTVLCDQHGTGKLIGGYASSTRLAQTAINSLSLKCGRGSSRQNNGPCLQFENAMWRRCFDFNHNRPTLSSRGHAAEL